jgi:hypothetical protein
LGGLGQGDTALIHSTEAGSLLKRSPRGWKGRERRAKSENCRESRPAGGGTRGWGCVPLRLRAGVQGASALRDGVDAQDHARLGRASSRRWSRGKEGEDGRRGVRGGREEASGRGRCAPGPDARGKLLRGRGDDDGGQGRGRGGDPGAGEGLGRGGALGGWARGRTGRGRAERTSRVGRVALAVPLACGVPSVCPGWCSVTPSGRSEGRTTSWRWSRGRRGRTAGEGSGEGGRTPAVVEGSRRGRTHAGSGSVDEGRTMGDQGGDGEGIWGRGRA